MAKPRSQFTRLGEHVARDTAREVRERAANGEPFALAELEALKAAATPESLRAKIWEIVRNHLADSDGILCEAGGGPPRAQGRASDAYAEALFEWLAQARERYEFDSPEGRAVEIVGLSAHAIHALDSLDPAFRLGFVLGYGISQKNHLLVREFADGPALAREAAMMDARSRGGEEKRKSLNITNTDRNRAICDRFRARSNRHQSKAAWAEDNAASEQMSVRNLRRILASC